MLDISHTNLEYIEAQEKGLTSVLNMDTAPLHFIAEENRANITLDAWCIE